MSELTFEQAVVELEGIITKLEEGRMPLEDAVKAFERGSELKKICEKKTERCSTQDRYIIRKKRINNVAFCLHAGRYLTIF